MNRNDSRSLEKFLQETPFSLSFFAHGRSRQWTGLLLNVLKATPKQGVRLACVRAVYSRSFPLLLLGAQIVYDPEHWFLSACCRSAQPGVVVPFEAGAWSQTKASLEEIQQPVREGSCFPSDSEVDCCAKEGEPR